MNKLDQTTICTMSFQLEFNRHITLILLTIATGGFSALAQDSDLIDNLNTDFLRPSAQPMQPPEAKTMSLFRKLGLNPKENESTNPAVASEKYTVILNYGFNYKHSYLDGSVTKMDSEMVGLKGPILPEVYYQLGLGVSESNVKSVSDEETASSLSVNPSLQLAWTHKDIFFPSKDSLLIGGAAAYTDTENSSAPGAKLAFSQASGWKETVNASYAYKATSNLEFSVTPSYSYGNNETVNIPINTTTMTYKENISAALGFKYIPALISTNLMVSGSAKWLHDISFSLAPGQNESLQDYGEFGGGLSYSGKDSSLRQWTLEADYAYDAFNSSYFSHAVTAKLNIDF